MGCSRHPFLVLGSEPFLKGHKVFNGSFPAGIETLRVRLDHDGSCQWSSLSGGADLPISAPIAEAAVHKLAKTGAYTHELGRYWAWRTLRAPGRLMQILARRYPYILVDEAQDVGSLHGQILLMLKECGASLSLIGDPNQAIFEFMDADGSFLRDFALLVPPRHLTSNRRSVAAIVAAASALSGSVSISSRDDPSRLSGAFLLHYEKGELLQVRKLFASILLKGGYRISEGAILCRGRSLVEQINGNSKACGKGATEKFARAAICRDRRGDIGLSFELAVDGLLRLLKLPPHTLRRDVLSGVAEPAAIAVRRALWRFLRNSQLGLPSALLPAKSQWHPALKTRVAGLLAMVHQTAGLEPSTSWGNNLTVGDLADQALSEAADMNVELSQVVVRTVHEVKGEGIPAVLYLARKPDITSLLAGPSTEDGRIGYVAVTRAQDLLFVGVPSDTKSEVLDQFAAIGLTNWTGET
jgi:hypothetical protein